MLSGSRPRGSSRIPVSGKIGMISGNGAGLRGLGASLMSAPAPDSRSREHQRRQAAARAEGQGVGRAHDLEEFDQLPPRRLLVPVAVAFKQGQQLVNRL